MYFGLNVSYLGLFVLKKFGNLHQIFLLLSGKPIAGLHKGRHFYGWYLFSKQAGRILDKDSKTSRNGNAACPGCERCLPKWGMLLAPVGHNQSQKRTHNVSCNEC